MKKSRIYIIIEITMLLLFINTFIGISRGQTGSQTNQVEGWAVILEINDYPDPYTDIINNFTDTKKWNYTLQTLGWKSENMFIVNGVVNRSDGEDGVNFLINSADENDIAFYYLCAHYYWILDEMEWKDWFDLMWDDIPCQRKMLVISSCLGEDLINPVRSDVNPHISIAAARDDELSWAGTEEEDLPIIGCVMNHYLTSALLKNSADSNLNGDVSVEEAFQYSYGQIRDYYTNVVFPAFPDETSVFGGVAPHPVMDDAYTGEFSLRLEGAEPLENAGFPIWLIIAPISAIGGVAVLFTLIVIRQRRK